MKAELIKSIPVHNTLGEGVVWDARDQSVWWTDIQESRLYRMSYPACEITFFDTPERLCCFAFTENPDRLLVAFASGFALFEYQSGAVHWLHRPPEVQPGSGRRLNDGRMDRHGRLWVGAMVEDENLAPSHSASLYCLERSGKLSTHKTDIAISNGMCWSPDNRFFYFADSPTRQIDAYKYDIARGNISGKTVFTCTPEAHFPDGAVTDSEGNMWSAHWGGSCVVRYAPDGNQLQTVEIPTCQPSCTAFGGADMTTLFVTSARQDLNSEQLAKDPQAGNLFIIQTSVRGLAEPVFQCADIQ
ncbi:MAG: SMP-30/gluconolactonase/LRE family protein [Porticoccaceae bacterium]|nr:SMP-30/gluconolactonase/LRE family protein [Porticoccaceae bacterium]